MISVCLASYNGADYIAAQLRSVLAQLHADDEIVVSDDGSTDETLAVIADLQEPRIRLLDSCSKLGVVKNFERALAAARGKVIFLCDQDDVWLPRKVEVSLAALKKCALVVSDCIVVNGDLKTISPSFFQLRDSHAGLFHNLWKNTYLGCCMAFRRELLEVALPFPRHIPMHDMWLGMIAELHGGTCFVPEPLVLYRRHGKSASDAAGKSKATVSKKISDRVFLACSVAGRTIRYRLS